MINNSMMRAALSIAAVAVGFGSGSAVAQESSSTRFFQGLYLSGAIGAHQTDDADLSGIGINVSNDTDWGPAALLAIGLELGDTNWRTELEGGYRDADVDSISGVSGSGDVEALSFVGNIFYDIPVSSNFEFYLGGGLGIVLWFRTLSIIAICFQRPIVSLH